MLNSALRALSLYVLPTPAFRITPSLDTEPTPSSSRPGSTRVMSNPGTPKRGRGRDSGEYDLSPYSQSVYMTPLGHSPLRNSHTPDGYDPERTEMRTGSGNGSGNNGHYTTVITTDSDKRRSIPVRFGDGCGCVCHRHHLAEPGSGGIGVIGVQSEPVTPERGWVGDRGIGSASHLSESWQESPSPASRTRNRQSYSDNDAVTLPSILNANAYQSIGAEVFALRGPHDYCSNTDSSPVRGMIDVKQKRYSAPAGTSSDLLSPDQSHEDWEKSMLQMMNRDISLALEPSPPQAPAPPSRRSKDPRPKSYPNSQSYSSKLFELELSPIFEDIQVFGSTSLCGLDDDGADEAIPDHEHSPEPDSEVPRWRPTIDEDGESVDSERDRGSESDEEGSDSSYGQLVEEKRFGSAAYDVSVGQEDSDIEVEEFWVDTKEQYEEFSACVEEDFKGDIMETHQLVPALTFTSPTPEESSSSGMGDCSDVPQEGKMALEDPRTCRFASQVVDETVEEVRRVTPTQWTDTMESSVNTVDGRNVGAWKHVDEHGRLARPPPLVIDPPTARRSLKEAEGSETQTRKRWSMASYQSQSSRKSATWSIRSSTSSIWRRVSGALFRGSRVPGDAILEGSHEFVESSNAHQRSPQEGDATSLNGDFHRERERNTGTSTLGPTRALAAGRMANDSEAVPEYRLHGVKGVRERLRNLPRRMGALSGQGANASTRRGRLSSLLRSGGNETPGHRRSLPASTV